MKNNSNDKHVIKELKDEYYRPMMFYNTTLRNVGLFSSISLTVMVVAVRAQSQNVKFMLRVLALLILMVCANIIYGLHKTFEVMKSNEQVEEYMKQWDYITYAVAFIVGIMIIYNIYKLYVEQTIVVNAIKKYLL